MIRLKNNRSKGVVAIEFVLLLPIFIAFFVLIVFYGYAFYLVRISQSAAQAGAEAAATQNPLNVDYDPTKVALFASKRVIDQYLINDSSSAEKKCIEPQRQNTSVSEFSFVVKIEFSNCKVIQQLTLSLPFVGSIPFDLGTYYARAVVEL